MFTDDYIIKEITEGDDWYSISADGCGFGLKKKWGVVPVVGDVVTIHSRGGSEIRGIDINGKSVYYFSDDELEKQRQEWLVENEKKKQKEFEENMKSMDEQYDKLPEVYKKRIDRFRENNPKFRVDFEQYEMFCCTQSILIAETLKTPEKIQEFQSMDWDEQKKAVPGLDDGHSGNTFGSSVRLAYWYLKQPEIIHKIHGALSTLVGSDEYGDNPDKKWKEDLKL